MTQVVDLGKLRFYWAGDWLVTTEYELNDVVRYGGNVYVYINVARTIGNVPTSTTYWALMVEGLNFVGTWSAATQYFIGVAGAYGSTIYVSQADNINKQPDLFPLIWSQFAVGIQFEGTYNNTVTYQPNDVVVYGPSTYIAIQTTNGNNPTNATYWTSFVQGISPTGVYNGATAYVPGDLVAYGANIYEAIANTTGNLPTNATYWTLFIASIRTRGNWASATTYYVNDIVTNGGNSYICLILNTSTSSFPTDLAAGKWAVFNGGIRWRDVWAVSTLYLVNDVVTILGNTYICVVQNTSSSNFNTDYTAGYWQMFASGSNILPVIPPSSNGYSLTIDNTGAALAWLNATSGANMLYVAKNGNDANPGNSMALPKLTIQAAVAAVPGGQKTAIFVSSGAYSELLLPIVVPPNVAIVGDSIRTTFVLPGAGLAADGVTPNNESTMWALSDGSLLTKMTFQGMTGWIPGSTAGDITTSTPKGIFCALNPASPIILKSPYVIECSSFSTGGIGAYVNGSAHANGNRSILFHEYTGIHNNGVGIWVDNNGKSEAVSVFTYYCYFGYATTRGGQLRSLSGNNSYGTYGSTSSGFSAAEVPITGTLYGTLITFTGPYTGTMNPGDTISNGAGVTATLTNVQVSSVYVTGVTGGTFTAGQTITSITSGGVGIVSTYGGQQGYTLVLSNLTAAPLVGQSVQIAGDSGGYVIQALSGSWVNASSVISIVLAEQKVTASADGSAVTLRSFFSLLRISAHDFLSVGTGGIATTNYPGTPSQAPNPANRVQQTLPGRVYYVSTDEQGNFNVGTYFSVNQATGAATLNANSFNLSGLTSLRLGSIGAQLGAQIDEFSTDGTMSQNSAVKVPTQSAVVTYVTTRVPQPIPTSVGQTGKYLTSLGSTVSWATVSATPQYTIKTANYTAVTGDNLFCNTSVGSFTITLPASPAVNDTINFADLAGTFASFNLNIARNGRLIMGAAEDLALDVQNASVALNYSGATYGWRLV